MQRLLRKFETAKALVPAPVRRDAKRRTTTGVIYFGSTTPAMHEALELLEAAGPRIWTPCASAAFPFTDEVMDFIAAHEQVFVVEQNRDAQLRTLMVNEGGVDPAKLIAVLHYDGTPITARFIAGEIATRMARRPRSPRPPNDLHPKPRLHHPGLTANALGFTRRDYEGSVSTLCAGCGHDSICAAIIQACFELDIAAAPARQAVRHRLLVQDARLFPRRVRTASTPCTDACRRC